VTRVSSMGGYEDLLGDGRLLKRIISEGDGAAVVEGCSVQVHYETRVVDTDNPEESKLIDSSDGELFDFVLGSDDVLEAWNLAITTMKPGERSTFLAHHSLTYGEDGAGEEIPPKATLEFMIHLFPKAKVVKTDTKAPVKADPAVREATRLERAKEAKERGNQLTRQGDFHGARKSYNEALMLIQNFQSFSASPEISEVVVSDMLREVHHLRLTSFLNLSQCELKMDDFSSAIGSAQNALELDPGNCKALYRRGVAQLRQGKLEEAKADLLKAFQTDPNAEIRARLEECREKLAATAQWHKDAFGGIFRKAPDQQARERNLATLPQVWLDFQIGNAMKNSTCHTYRVTIALYSDTVPRTAENFRCLCTGERGLGAHGAPLHFRRSLVYKVVPRSILEAGDIVKFNGTGGESIYGPTFADENFTDSHHKRGLLSMVNRGPNTNNSKFMFTLRSLPELDGKHVVFGEVLSGFDALDAMEMVETEYPDWPLTEIKVVQCGDRSP